MKRSLIIFILLHIGFISEAQQTHCYEYDDLNRLTLATYKDGTQIQYEYDALGNRVLLSVNLDCPVSTGLVVTNTTETTADVSWTNAGFPGTVDHFDVELSTDNSTFTVVADDLAATSFTLTGLTENQTYYVRIIANCTVGDPNTSSAVAFSTGQDPDNMPIGDCEDEDNEDPQFSNCPNTTLTYGNDPDECGAYVNFSIPVAVDNCPGVVVTHSSGPLPGDFVDVGMATVVYTAVDTAGNATDCTFQIQVLDTQQPLISCPTGLTYDNDFGQCSRQVFGIAPKLAWDNCDYEVTWSAPGATPSSGVNDASGSTFPVGTTAVTYTISETSNPDGNQVASCSFDITIIDAEDPVINTCPTDITVSNDPGDCGAIVTYETPTFNDNCDGTVLPGTLIEGLSSGSFFPVGTTVVEYEYIDNAGNGPVICSFTVTVLDTENPEIFCEQVIHCETYTNETVFDIHPLDVSTSVITVPANTSITDVNVPAIIGSHPSMGDVTMTLTSPSGTEVVLFDQSCSGSAAFDFGLDDQTAGTFAPGPCAPFDNGFAYQPVSPLAAFNGENSLGDWTLSITSAYEPACGIVESWSIEICGNNNDPAGFNQLDVIAGAGSCAFIQLDTFFDPPFSDNCPGATITHDYIFGPFDHTLEGAEFPIGSTTVTWTVTDASGNTDECVIVVNVLDNEAPEFTNCPRPDIIQDAEPGICGAYVNFSPPTATDNCGAVVVSQTDATGLSTGSVFPVGMTILDFEATDPSGNVSQCSLRIIVNDTQVPNLVCPGDVTQTMDDWQCNAVVNDIAPLQTADNCYDNVSVVYQIEYPSGSGEIVASGVTDASGNVFEKGTSTVSYRLTDQPVLLITEVSHEIGILNGGMDPVPYTVITGDDYLEITNLGPAAYNVSELEIERFGESLTESYLLPNTTIVQPGETIVIHFGNGVDDPANLFFNVPCATNLTTGAEAAYAISFKGRTLDVVAVNGYDPTGNASLSNVTAADWSGAVAEMNGRGGIYRPFSFDNNEASDWEVADVCMPITIGVLNPELEAYDWNGQLTALQSIAPNTLSCSFDVTITDDELPYCGEFLEHVYADATNLGVTGSITGGAVFKSEINVPENYTVGDVDLLDLVGSHPEMNDLTFKLTSPSGTQVIVWSGLCPGTADFDVNIDEDSLDIITDAACGPLGSGGWYQPQNTFKPFYGEQAQGIWSLEIADTTAANDGMLANWNLRLYEIANYSQMDTILENDPGFCGAEFSWIHPRLIDNCCEGDIEVKYLTPSFIEVPESGPIVGGSPVTEYFEVGETIVRYILTDASGNVDSCEFVVTVLDVEDPVVVCPNDIIINLTGGECREIVNYDPLSATDNCAVVDTIMTPPSGSWFEIGTTEVEIIIVDSVGNADTCYFDVIVNEYVPDSYTLTCNDEITLALDADCEEEVTADMVLEGNEYHCYEDYVITVLGTDGFPIPTSPIVTVDYIGQTLTVMVYDPDSDNTCWTTLYVEDNALPVIECPADTLVKCNADLTPDALGYPALLSCELSVSDYYSDDITNNGNCEDPIQLIERIWTVTDESGNFSNCIQVIEVERITFADLEMPPNYDGIQLPAFDCAAVDANPDLIDPVNTGVPSVAGVPFATGDLCSITINQSDEIFNDCDGTYVIVRTWSILDFCEPFGPANPWQYQQFIKVEDTEAPVVDCPDAVYANAGNGDCTANVQLPAISYTDNCSSVSVSTDTPIGTVYGNGTLVTGVPLGSYEITYYIQDNCGNLSTCITELVVEDQTAPVSICDEITEVVLSSDGTATVLASVFDDGSYDNCELAYFEVSRMNGDCAGEEDDFGPSVEFCCSDVPDNPIMVVFRAYDIYGNYNNCMVEVEVQDKLPPFVISCPAPTSLNCDTYLEDLALALENEDYSVLEPFGESPEFYDNCALNIEYEVVVNIDNCAEGTISRVWTATDDGDNVPAVCSQLITVEHTEDWVVEFPEDLTVECTDGQLPEFGEPEIFFDACELIATSYEDQYFYVVPDACYKIVRTWTIINWCVYDDFGSNDYIEYPEADILADWDGDGDSDDRTFRSGYTDSGLSDGFVTYDQVIKVNDEEPPVFTVAEIDGCITDTDCDTDLTLPYPDITDDCSVDFVVDLNGDFGAFADISGDVVVEDVVPGSYTLVYSVTDNCGNTSFETVFVEVSDCKLPTPYCENGIVVEIMQTGMIEVWASDLDLGSFDNCPGDLLFSFSPDTDDVGVVYTCDDIGQQPVEVWVTDVAGNQDFCETYVVVQDNMGNCGSGPVAVAGLITTEYDDPVEAVMVEVNSGQQSYETQADGLYEFQLASGNDYSVSPMLDIEPLNGVTTFDMVIISQHILGVDLLDSPYQMIAADANNSGSISTLDLLTIQKLILILEDNFPNNTSWRFVDADYEFPNPQDPWQEVFPELISYNNLATDDLEADFIAVKVGDVNGSAQANGLASANDRSGDGIYLVNCQEAPSDEENQRFVFSGMLENISAQQFSLLFDPELVEVVELIPGFASKENDFGLQFLEKGVLTFASISSSDIRKDSDNVLFELVVKTSVDISGEEIFQISDNYTDAIVYTENGNSFRPALFFGGLEQEGYALFQNIPNPFTGETTVPFMLAQSGWTKLEVYDLAGRVLWNREAQLEAGGHQWVIEGLKAKGVLYYTITVNGFSKTRRMVLE
ncbi:MAG: HYR domain-containing protein [Bacteroidetes bacterium]|nr:HYR domain-containing protein [Bacteroidota bacterium]